MILTDVQKVTIKTLFDITGATSLAYSIGGRIMLDIGNVVDVVKVDNLPLMYSSMIIGIVWAIINGYVKVNKWVVEKRERTQQLRHQQYLHDVEMRRKEMELQRDINELNKLERELLSVDKKLLAGRIGYMIKDDDLYGEAFEAENKHQSLLMLLIEKQKERDALKNKLDASKHQ